MHQLEQNPGMMVEKNEDNIIEAAVLVEAITEQAGAEERMNNSSFRQYSVGSAIEKFSKQVLFGDGAFSGIQASVVASLTASADSIQQGTNAKHFVVPELLSSLPTLILMRIHLAILQKKASHTSVAKKGNAGSLKPGNVVALYETNQRKFIRIYGTSKAGFEKTDPPESHLGIECSSIVFLVMDTEYDDRIALYNPFHRRFLACGESSSSSAECGYSISSMHDTPRHCETFKVVVPIKGDKRVRLQAFNGNTVSFSGYSDIHVYDVQGFDAKQDNMHGREK